ncbi:MAG: hypothetical protein ACI906_000630 [Candidatus Latescibacterota bacterium]|jgi:hypothetical protein
MHSSNTRAIQPQSLKIGDRFLLSFNEPKTGTTQQTGRLQDLKNGALCIDVDPDCRPPRGTPVSVSSLRTDVSDFHFSSEILGRHRLHGRLPVLLIKAPKQIDDGQRRTSHRVSAALKSEATWLDDKLGPMNKPGVLTNISGGGARLFMRHLPNAERLHLDACVPESFIEEWALRRVGRLQKSVRNQTIFADPLQQTCAQLLGEFERIECRIVKSSVHNRDDRGAIHSLALSFLRPHEGYFRLVSFLERQALQRGIEGKQPRAAA